MGNSARRDDAQQRRAEVMRLRRQGMQFEEIGDRLGVTKQRAHQIYKEALDEVPVEEVTLYRAEQFERLDALLVEANKILERKHITVSNGKVIYVDEQPLLDDGPTLAAIATILRIEERRAKLIPGLEKQEVEVDGTLRYEIIGVDLDQLK